MADQACGGAVAVTSQAVPRSRTPPRVAEAAKVTADEEFRRGLAVLLNGLESERS